jgi:hypothetical protein
MAEFLRTGWYFECALIPHDDFVVPGFLSLLMMSLPDMLFYRTRPFGLVTEGVLQVPTLAQTSIILIVSKFPLAVKQ